MHLTVVCMTAIFHKLITYNTVYTFIHLQFTTYHIIQCVYSRGLPLKVFDNVIQNLLDSWLDCKIPDFIIEIPVHQIRKAYVT